MTRRIAWWSLSFSLLIMSAGCVYSIQPWFRSDVQVFEKQLLGLWEGEEMILYVAPGSDSSRYAVSYIARNGGSFEGEGMLGRIGSRLFVDFTFTDDTRCESWEAHMHLILRVELTGQKLVLSYPLPDSLDVVLQAAMREEGSPVAGVNLSLGKLARGLLVSAAAETLLWRAADRSGHWEPWDRLRRRKW